ncbi:hypothetical protein ACFX13_012970 [Malus domestica]
MGCCLGTAVTGDDDEEVYQRKSNGKSTSTVAARHRDDKYRRFQQRFKSNRLGGTSSNELWNDPLENDHFWPRRRRRVGAVLAARRLRVALQSPACGLQKYLRRSRLLSQVLAVTAANQSSGNSSRF